MTDERKSRGATILVVDDDDQVRRLHRRVLETAGFSVLEARDGGEALRVARLTLGRLALLLTDVEMPGTGGLELAAQVRAVWPQTPVIYVTGDPGAASSIEVTENEVVLHKPVEPGRLVSVVGEMTARRPPSRGGRARS